MHNLKTKTALELLEILRNKTTNIYAFKNGIVYKKNSFCNCISENLQLIDRQTVLHFEETDYVTPRT